jgi:hypothetical protein
MRKWKAQGSPGVKAIARIGRVKVLQRLRLIAGCGGAACNSSTWETKAGRSGV